MPPIIGITINRTINPYGQGMLGLTEAYVQAVVQAGGVPVLIPSLVGSQGWQTVYAGLDGILFSGGGDMSPEQFGGEPHPRIGDIDSQRDLLELQLLHQAAADGKPFLGLCRGCQMVNVGFGGTLYTHIADQLQGALVHDHPGNMRGFLAHEVKLEEGTRIGAVMGAPILGVNSHHHQGLKDIGSGLRATGRAADGLVEAIELPDHPFGIAVQWHPEWLTDQQPTRNLFSRFVQAAAQAQLSPRAS